MENGDEESGKNHLYVYTVYSHSLLYYCNFNFKCLSFVYFGMLQKINFIEYNVVRFSYVYTVKNIAKNVNRYIPFNRIEYILNRK